MRGRIAISSIMPTGLPDAGGVEALSPGLPADPERRASKAVKLKKVLVRIINDMEDARQHNE